jgi:uncharacterized membrane protein
MPALEQRTARAVPPAHAWTWFAEAMRLWKRGPATFSTIACIVVVSGMIADPIPGAGFLVANVVSPLLGTGLLFASLAADRGERPRLRHMIAVFVAPAAAILAVVASALAIFGAEAIAAAILADVNLFMPMREASTITPGTVMVVFAVGVAASLPVTFVPFAALFDGAGFADAFALSWQAFQRNVPALTLYAVLAFLLLLAGLATMGIGLVLALPWIAAASYAAWKDVFAVGGTAAAGSVG